VEDVQVLIKREIDRAGSTRELAIEWGVEQRFVQMLAKGAKKPGSLIRAKLGLPTDGPHRGKRATGNEALYGRPGMPEDEIRARILAAYAGAEYRPTVERLRRTIVVERSRIRLIHNAMLATGELPVLPRDPTPCHRQGRMYTCSRCGGPKDYEARLCMACAKAAGHFRGRPPKRVEAVQVEPEKHAWSKVVREHMSREKGIRRWAAKWTTEMAGAIQA
jgi:hypothetical protein